MASTCANWRGLRQQRTVIGSVTQKNTGTELYSTTHPSRQKSNPSHNRADWLTLTDLANELIVGRRTALVDLLFPNVTAAIRRRFEGTSIRNYRQDVTEMFSTCRIFFLSTGPNPELEKLEWGQI